MPVFESDYTISSGTLMPRIEIFDDAIPTSQLKNVIVLANFDVIAQEINTNFPYSGTWYDLMDASGNTTIDGSTTSVTIPAGGFRVYGNQSVGTLSLEEFEVLELGIYPNPANTSFQLNVGVNNLKIYDLTGKLVKEFNGSFSKNNIYDISSLGQGIYLVKASNNNHESFTLNF